MSPFPWFVWQRGWAQTGTISSGGREGGWRQRQRQRQNERMCVSVSACSFIAYQTDKQTETKAEKEDVCESRRMHACSFIAYLSCLSRCRVSLAHWKWDVVCLLVGCLTSQQHTRVFQGRICTDNFTCCHTEVETADQTFYLTQSQYTDTGPTSPSADPIMPGAWQGSHWSAIFSVTGMTRPRKIAVQAGFEPRIFRSRGGRLNN